jgi:hypothetical protein
MGKIFMLGEYVRWKSQARGVLKEKKGYVAQVVEPGGLPNTNLYRFSKGVGPSRRLEVSYVIVAADGGQAYWPLTRYLKSVNA